MFAALKRKRARFELNPEANNSALFQGIVNQVRGGLAWSTN